MMDSDESFTTLKDWVESVNDDQFWSLQYSEHCEFIALSLPDTYQEVKDNAKGYKDIWETLHFRLLKNPNETIPQELLEDFRIFMANLYLLVADEQEWTGWLTLSAYEDMLSEVEYLQQEKTLTRTLSFWHDNMLGHTSLDAAWIDPVHEDLVQKSKEYATAFSELKQRAGENKPYFDRIRRKEEGTEPRDLDKTTGDVKKFRQDLKLYFLL